MYRLNLIALIFSTAALLLGFYLPVTHAENKTAFKQAMPGYIYQFPKDHASHPSYKTEWWYYTGHLQAIQNSEKKIGYELTFFRSATGLPKQNKTSWQADNFHLVHFAITDESHQKFYHTAKLNRGAPGGSKHTRAGANTENYNTWNENWSVKLNANGQHVLHAATPELDLSLTLTPAKPPVIHGKNGISQKADCVGCASHYYSYTRLASNGKVRIGKEVFSVMGQSWMDHEFGSNQLQPQQIGWDWFSIQLANNTEIMLYVLRRNDGTLDPNSSGTWVNTDGESTHLSLNDFSVETLKHWQSPDSKGRYPSEWKLTLPSKGINLTIIPVLANQELTDPRGSALSYWEGRCVVDGSIRNKNITGNAYVEMTGYAKPFAQGI